MTWEDAPLFLERELGFSNGTNVKIQQIDYLGEKKEDKPRPVFLGFLKYKNFGNLFKLGHHHVPGHSIKL